jgi:hypothetical protein
MSASIRRTGRIIAVIVMVLATLSVLYALNVDQSPVPLHTGVFPLAHPGQPSPAHPTPCTTTTSTMFVSKGLLSGDVVPRNAG